MKIGKRTKEQAAQYASAMACNPEWSGGETVQVCRETLGTSDKAWDLYDAAVEYTLERGGITSLELGDYSTEDWQEFYANVEAEIRGLP